MTAQGYTTTDVCDLLGLTWRMIDYWDRTKLVSPSLRSRHGSGHAATFARQYAESDLIRLAVIKALLDAGVSLQRAREILALLDDELLPDAAIIIIDGPRTTIAHDGHEVEQALADSYGACTVLALDTILSPLRARLDQRTAA